MKIFVVTIVTLLVVGCASYAPIQSGYGGAKATVADSYADLDGKCGKFFVLSQYNGHSVHNAVDATAAASQGQGPMMSAQGAEREVPAQEATFHILGQTRCAMPLITLTRTNYLVQGDIHFTPEAGKVYVVTGELEADHSAVWVREKSSQRQVGNKLLIHGAAKPGAFGGGSTTVEQIGPQG